MVGRVRTCDVTYTTTLTGTDYKSGFQSNKDTPYLILTAKLWGVFDEDFFRKLTKLL